MDSLANTLILTALLGAGATLLMDAWLLLLQRAGVAALNFDFIGRWVGHLLRGRLRHRPIAASAPIRGERLLGWVTHYATGVLFAALLVAIEGRAWLLQPQALPALVLGVLTVAIPLLLIQPAMGAGLASRKTATPLRNSLKSLTNHAVFGLGLYLTGTLLAPLAG